MVSFFVLAAYALLSSFTLKRESARKIDWVRSKPWVACAGKLERCAEMAPAFVITYYSDSVNLLKIKFQGMFTTVLSIISAFGFLFLIGVHYNVINTIIPFLIIGEFFGWVFSKNVKFSHRNR